MSIGVGIDVGISSVTVAAVRKRSGSLALERFAQLRNAELVPGDPEPSPQALAKAAVARLEGMGFRPGGVVLGVSGRDAIIRYSHLPPMPEWRLALLMDLEIEDVSERTGEPLSADWRVLPSEGGGNLVLVALAKDARVTESVTAFEAAGLEVRGAVPQPVATGDAFRFLGEADGKITLVLDIGGRSTEIAIVDDGELIFARSVALGGDAFTERLAKLLGTSVEDAEEIKRSGKAPAGRDPEEVFAAPTQQLTSMVSASVDFARAQLKRRRLKIDAVAVCGGGARIPGLVEALGEALGCPAAPFDPLADLGRGRADRASREAADAHGLEGVTALGLALAAVLPRATRLDLLPLSVKERLEFRHRTLFLYLAVGALAAALAVSFGTSIWAYLGERGRRERLAAASKAVAARLARHQERVQQDDRREADLKAMADRARPGYHLAALLATLGEVTPPELSLDEGDLVQDDPSGAFHFEFTGVADDAEGTGVAAMRKLEVALLGDPLIASAQILPQGTPEGSRRRFVLKVVPRGNPKPPKDAP